MGYNKDTGAVSVVGKLAAGGGIVQWKTFNLKAAASTAETSLAFVLPTRSYIPSLPLVLVTAAGSAGAKLSVGLLSSSGGGSATGFISSLATSSSGLFQPGPTTSTSGANGIFLVSNTIGSFLSTFTSGSTGTGTLGDCGLLYVKPHLADSVTAKTLTWTINSSGTAFAAQLLIPLVEYPA